MKRWYAGWVFAVVVFTLACSLGAMQQPQGQVGRYQLMQGQVEVVGEGATANFNVVFRIDTVTGDTLEYKAVVEGENAGIGWIPVGYVRR
jgi:hypothetical protein